MLARCQKTRSYYNPIRLRQLNQFFYCSFPRLMKITKTPRTMDGPKEIHATSLVQRQTLCESNTYMSKGQKETNKLAKELEI